MVGRYQTVRDTHVGSHAPHLDLSFAAWAKDGVLALFFSVAGPELNRELVVGELSSRKAAPLPVIAAVGGDAGARARGVRRRWRRGG